MRVSYALDAAADPDGEDSPLTGMAPSPSLAAAAPTYPLRKAFYLNDMRSWYGSVVPGASLLMCGGENDPTVFYSVNTGTMAAFWHGVPTISTLDVDPSAGPSGPYALLQGAFQASQLQEFAYLQTAAGGDLSATAAEQQLVGGYHLAVAPFCALAAREFFTEVLAE